MVSNNSSNSTRGSIGPETVQMLLKQRMDSFGLSEFMFGMSIFYGLLCTFGLLGNVWVISTLIRIFHRRRIIGESRNLFMYILILSIVDSLVLLNLPILITNMTLHQWIFGPYLCKLYWITESINKILSTFVLVVISFERYMTVCHPLLKQVLHMDRVGRLIIGVIIITVVILLTPIYIYAYEEQVTELFNINNVPLKIDIPRCNLVVSFDMMFTITIYLFIVGFCIPSLLISFFYARILCKLSKHSQGFGDKSQVPVGRVTCNVLLLVLFYFACWSPYWFTTLKSIISPRNTNPTRLEMQIMHFLHSLVYINSAVNWVLYAFMNKHLQESNVSSTRQKTNLRLRVSNSACTIPSVETKYNCMTRSLSRIFSHSSPDQFV